MLDATIGEHGRRQKRSREIERAARMAGMARARPLMRLDVIELLQSRL